MAHMVLHPHGIATTFLKLDSWSPGAVLFIPNISTNGINQIKKGNLKKQVLCFMYTKRFTKFLKIWEQFRVGAIPRLP